MANKVFPITKARTKTVPRSRQREAFLGVQTAPRLLPPYTHPVGWVEGWRWREFVKQQPVMGVCARVLIAQLSALPWNIVARDADETDKLRDEIEYHTDVLNKAAGENFDIWLERGLQDLFTLPMGWNSEVGYFKDGTLAWVDNLDGATLAPTFDPEYPLVQIVPGAIKAVLYPKESVSRAYLMPRPELERRGWGMAPPEAVYLAVKMLLQGDRYYWSFVVDTPEAGLLDLMDMSRESAEKWLLQWTNLMQGADPYKIGVLYEHTKEARFIPFQRPPSETMMGETMAWYAAVVSAGYGISLSEVGLGRNETLAGSIREDRRSKKTGFGQAVEKVIAHLDPILPKHLRFTMENRDDEALTNLGRARSTSFTAMRQAIESGIMDAPSALAQLKMDGLLDAAAKLGTPPVAQGGPNNSNKRFRKDEKNDDLDRPEDQGGHGQVKASVEKALSVLLPVYRQALAYSYEDMLDLGNAVRLHIMAPQGEVESFVTRSIEASSESPVEREHFSLALDIASEVLAKPWARRTLERAHRVELLRGSTAYYRITKIMQGAVNGC